MCVCVELAVDAAARWKQVPAMLGKGFQSILDQQLLAVLLWSASLIQSQGVSHCLLWAEPCNLQGLGSFFVPVVCRKSALERIAMPRSNGTSSTSSVQAPTSSSVTAAKPRRASVVPFTSTRMRPTAPPSQSPSQATGAVTLSATPAAGMSR